MSYPINYPTPQGANVQIFRGRNGSTSNHYYLSDWIKPQGASFVWFTLIGAGGGGGGGAFESSVPNYYAGGGGASGNVTNFMCPAFLLPDVLQVQVGDGGNGGNTGSDGPAVGGMSGGNTVIFYQQKTGSGYNLLQAAGGGGGGGADGTPGSAANGGAGSANSAETGGPITAAGFYQSIGGQNGAAGNVTIGAPGLTFVMGGNGGYFPLNTTNSYYGYSSKQNGYSQLSPIPVSIPCSTDMPLVKQGSNSYGCGGNGGGDPAGVYSRGGRGGDGLAIIVTW